MTLLDKIKKFEELMDSYSNYGSCDTEPQWQLKNAIRCKINDNVEKIPKDADGWELYSSMDGADEVASKLSKELKPIIDAIEKAPYNEVKEVIAWYGI